MCGGCHEDRTKTTNVTPGLLDTFAAGATKLMNGTQRGARINTAPVKPTDIVGVGWSTMVQPIFTQNCVTGCHDANNSAGVPGYTITDPKAGTTLTWTLNLTGDPLPASFSVVAGGGAYSASYFSMAGPDMEAVEKNGLMISGFAPKQPYMQPLTARTSTMFKVLNPAQLFPTPSAGVHAFPGATHLSAKGKADLSPTDMYMLILAADMGVNYYARENKPTAP
jgi:hypothetical protein